VDPIQLPAYLTSHARHGYAQLFEVSIRLDLKKKKSLEWCFPFLCTFKI